MATQKSCVTEERNDPNIITEAPPSFEQAMAETKMTLDEHCSKKSFFHSISITGPNKKEKNNEKPEIGFVLKEIEENQKQQQTADGANDNEETEKGSVVPIISCFRKFINCLKVMSALTTIISDLVLWACGLALLIGGCYVMEQKMELVQVLVIYQKQFRAIGQSFITCGVIYMAVVAPFGIVGALRHKRVLLKWHNICLLLSLMAEGIIFYLLFKYVNKTAEKDKLSDFQSAFKEFYVTCLGQGEQCCCRLAGSKNRRCWSYYSTASRDDDMIYFETCTEKEDLYVRIQKVIKQGLFFLPIFMAIQANGLFFGWLVIKGIPQPCRNDLTDSIESIVEVRPVRRSEKKRFNLFYKVLLFFVLKRIFIILLIMLFTFLVYLIKIWAQQRTVEIKGAGKQNLWDIISSIFSFK